MLLNTHIKNHHTPFAFILHEKGGKRGWRGFLETHQAGILARDCLILPHTGSWNSYAKYRA